MAVHGLGGLGHLAVQFASRMGFRTIAVARGADKRPLAGQLGAAEYVDAAQGSAGQTLARMGGARLILATAPSAAAIEDIMAASAPVASSCWSRPYPSRSGCNRCP